MAEQTATVDSARLAVLAALNIADEYHILKRKYDAIASEFNQRAHSLSGALDEVPEAPPPPAVHSHPLRVTRPPWVLVTRVLPAFALTGSAGRDSPGRTGRRRSRR